jgi:hypothetical protein
MARHYDDASPSADDDTSPSADGDRRPRPRPIASFRCDRGSRARTRHPWRLPGTSPRCTQPAGHAYDTGIALALDLSGAHLEPHRPHFVTMQELERKAVAQGADLNVVTAAALRSGAHAA